MRAMVLHEPQTPLVPTELTDPEPQEGQVLLDVSACAVCRTDLHILDSDLREPKLPLVLGHEIVGKVIEVGDGVERYVSVQNLAEMYPSLTGPKMQIPDTPAIANRKIASIASSISSMLAIPVERITGFFFLAICFNSSKSVISKDATLNAGTPIL